MNLRTARWRQPSAVPVKIVTVFQDKPSWDLIAQPEMKTMSQLRGKNIAVMSPEGSLAIVAREMLRRNGIDPNRDVNLVVMGGDSIRTPRFRVRKRERAIQYMADSLRLTDRDLAGAIYDIQSKLVVRDGASADSVLQSMVDEMKRATKVQRELKLRDVFDLSLVKKANEELEAIRWTP